MIIDEAKIRPTTVWYSGEILNGMAEKFTENESEPCKATSMLGIIIKCLHGGPMIKAVLTTE